MAAKRSDERAKLFYELYKSGLTLREIGEKHSVSNQTIHSMFSRRGWPLRKKTAKHHQEFQGRRYGRNPIGYYVGTSRAKGLMHRDVWTFHNGPIPDGHQVHHSDGNRGNNSIENLLLVEASDHARRHMQARMHLHNCPHCGGSLFPE